MHASGTRVYSDELTYRSGVNGYAYIWGTQYVGIIGVTNQHTIPCAVCYVPARPTVLMIPGKASCHPTWTREYFGYLMSEHTGENRHRSMYECVDKDLQSLSLSPNYGSALYAVEADCSLVCPVLLTLTLKNSTVLFVQNKKLFCSLQIMCTCMHV